MADDAGCRIHHMLAKVKNRHCDRVGIAQKIYGDHHLEDIFKEHPCIDIMHVVLFCQHGDQFIAHDERDDHSRDRQDHAIRKAPDHAENTAVPSLWCHSNLRRDVCRALVDFSKHVLQVGFHH